MVDSWIKSLPSINARSSNLNFVLLNLDLSRLAVILRGCTITVLHGMWYNQLDSTCQPLRYALAGCGFYKTFCGFHV